jgi:glycosyltransferase involved in cell wall biosynthesis
MDTKTPLVSIITPTYNSSQFIVETIESILAQRYTNWELLITDDCSTDNTIEIIQLYINKDSRIKLFQLEKNSGAGPARNNSIKEARGRFIAFCDSDDLWYPEKLEQQITFMKNNNYDFTFTQKDICNSNGDIVRINYYCPKKVSLFANSCLNRIGTTTVIYDVNSLGKIYMPALPKRQDWALWLLLLKKTKYAHGLKSVLSTYRIRQNSLSSKKSKLIKYHYLIYRDILNYSKLKSIFILCFINAFGNLYKKTYNYIAFNLKH